MFTVRYPVPAFDVLRRQVDRLFDDFSGDPLGVSALAPRTSSYPALNVWEAGDDYFVEAECPGLNPEELEVFATGNELTLSGRRKEEKLDDYSVHRTERGTGSFARSFVFPTDVDSDKVEASLRDGVLTVKLPKAESAKRKKISVST